MDIQVLIHTLSHFYNLSCNRSVYACICRQKRRFIHNRRVSGDIASSSEVPEEFLTAWKEAVRSQSRTQKNHLFQKWLHAGGSWAMCLDQTLSIYVQQLSVVCIRGLSDYVEQLVISRLKIVHERSTEDRNRARRRMGPLAKDVFEEVVCWCQNQ